MKLVQLTSALSKRFGDEKAIRMIKEAGFDGLKKFLRLSRKILDRYIEICYTTTCKEKYFTGGAFLWKK
jgi:hypothetical protein